MAEIPSVFSTAVQVRREGSEWSGYLTPAWFRYLADLSSTFGLSPPITLAQDNLEDALTLTTPDSTNAAWDSTPLAALHILGPPTATTRNFLAGIWVETNASATDKGRGIMVTNTGASDSIYLQGDGVGCTNLASLLTAAALNATAIVVGTTDATQQGVVIRQETSIVPTAGGILVVVEAEGSATEMVRINSATVAGQIGFVFRMFAANAKPIVVKDGGGVDQFVLNNVGQMFVEGTIQNGASSQAANNAQNVTVANVGPGGAGISIQEWLIHVNSAGATRYIPLFG